MKGIFFVISIFILLLTYFFISRASYAFTSGIASTVAIGQKDFVSSQANQGGTITASSISSPSAVLVVGSKLLVADGGNNRVLVYNNIPTQNNQPADIVIGQQNMTTGSS